MNIEIFREYCLSKPGTEDCFPFDENVLVFKVIGKMFAACNVTDEEFRVNLKCDPERSIELRDEFEEIIPGYHMNKKHWNTVYMEGMLSQNLIKELIDHSYDLVTKSLPKAKRALLNE